MALVFTAAGFADACRAGALVLTRSQAPPDFQQRCELGALIDGDDLARRGGGFIYSGGRIERAWSARTQRPWTRSQTSIQE